VVALCVQVADVPSHSHVSPKRVLLIGLVHPPNRMVLPLAVSYAIATPLRARGPVDERCVHVPAPLSHSQVSPNTLRPSVPPKATIFARAPSKAMPAPQCGDGPEVARCVHVLAASSHSHSVLLPNNTSLLRTLS